MDTIASARLQFWVFLGISLVVLGLVAVLYFADPLLFQRFLGRINPLLAFLFVSILGFLLFALLLFQQWFAIYQPGNLGGLWCAVGSAALFGIIIIVADTKIIFPADTNILFPASLLFYPAIGYLVEILFHLLPLTVLLLLLKAIFVNTSFNMLLWICIPIVSFLEPLYQANNMISANRYPLWAVLLVGIHIFLINFVQLLLLRKYDFVTMYSFRLVYYLFWHIGWGYVRLRLLF